MIGQPKALASLSSSLLARKGHARPAMKPQGFAGMSSTTSLDDLGWNDMGDGPGQPAVPAAVAPASVVPIAPVDDAAPATMPPVLTQREALKEEIETPVVSAEPDAPAESDEGAASVPAPMATDETEMRPVSVATAARIGRETARALNKGGKAAFTLRLDGDRHLRLRLASALMHRSSQALVTEALDALLASLPQVEALVGQLPARKGSR